MPLTKTKLRVLIVDDNRDGADALGLVVEAFGNLVHVTYGGAQALDVATTFRPDLMLIDLAMPEIDGCDLVKLFRKKTSFLRATIVAITGHTDEEHKSRAMSAGFNAVLYRPVSLKEIESLLAGVKVLAPDRLERSPPEVGAAGARSRLPISEARRIRSERSSKTLTESESEAAICEGMIRFQEEYLGWRSEQIYAHFIRDLLVIRIKGVLTLAERQLGKSLSPAKGRDLIKQVRKQLLELARPMLESLVHEVTGVKALSMHHDISTVSGEELVVFALIAAPRFG